MARVFVSCTFKDLEECREEVRLNLKRMGHEDSAMKYFVAEDNSSFGEFLRKINSSNIQFNGKIVAQR